MRLWKALSQKRAFPFGGGTRKLDRGFDAFAAGGSEENLFQITSGELAETAGQFAREIANVALQHHGAAVVQFRVQRLDNCGVVMAGVMDTIAGQEIENHFSGSSVKLSAGTKTVLGLHLEEAEKPDPLRVDVINICLYRTGGRDAGAHDAPGGGTGLPGQTFDVAHSRRYGAARCVRTIIYRYFRFNRYLRGPVKKGYTAGSAALDTLPEGLDRGGTRKLRAIRAILG